jgi:hypothetical protein
VCYAREGQLDNARVMLSEAVSQLDEEDDDYTAVRYCEARL